MKLEKVYLLLFALVLMNCKSNIFKQGVYASEFYLETTVKERENVVFVKETIALTLYIKKDSTFTFYKLLRAPLDTTGYKCKYFGKWKIRNDSLILDNIDVHSNVFIYEKIGSAPIKKDTCSEIENIKFKIKRNKLILSKVKKLYLLQ